jgi:hypothetical protein
MPILFPIYLRSLDTKPTGQTHPQNILGKMSDDAIKKIPMKTPNKKKSVGIPCLREMIGASMDEKGKSGASRRVPKI